VDGGGGGGGGGGEGGGEGGVDGGGGGGGGGGDVDGGGGDVGNGGGTGANGYYRPGHRCASRRWHPSISSPSPTCTNTDSDDVPEYWNNPLMAGVTMFDDPDRCCDKLRLSRGGLECEVREAEDCVDGDAANGQGGGGGDDAGAGGGSGGGRDWRRECEEGRRWHVSKSRDGTWCVPFFAIWESRGKLELLARVCRTLFSSHYFAPFFVPIFSTNDDDFPPIWGEEYYLGRTVSRNITADPALCCSSRSSAPSHR